MDKNSTVYFMGIAGTGMAATAGLMQEAGYRVCGSDDKIYPPMSTMLAELGIPVFSPYSKDNLTQAKPDLVVVANSLSRGHEEVQALLESGLPYTSFAALLGKTFLSTQKSLVVAGTHGKTTTTSLLAFALAALGEEPSFMVGGVPRDFPKSYRLGSGSLFVIEGDEYDTAFFDKQSKFLHYHPYFVILNNIEFDHADIFADLAAVEATFAKLLVLAPEPRHIIANRDDPGVARLLAKLGWTDAVTQVACQGGEERGAEVRLVNLAYRPAGQHWEVRLQSRLWGELCVRSCLGGAHNAANIAQVVACLGLLQQKGLLTSDCTAKRLVAVLEAFQGVQRRLDHVLQVSGVDIYQDFAHHPTAVKHVIRSLRTSHPGRRLIVAFEPRNATSRRNVFQNDYAEVFREADIALFGACPPDARIAGHEKMDTRALAAAVGSSAHAFDDNRHLLPWLLEHSMAGDTVVFMSAGSFSGIAQEFGQLLVAAKP